MTLPQIRHALGELLPPWLQGEAARSFGIEGLFTTYDVDSALFREILMSRMPSFCAPDALPLLFADRRLRRGPFEADLASRRRLRLWLDQWQLAGLAAGMLLAVQAFLAPEYPQIRIITRRSIFYTLEAGAVGRLLALPGYEPLPAGPGGDLTPAARLRASGLYSRVRAPLGTWDFDSISNPEHAGRRWHFWTVVHGAPLIPALHYDSGVTYGGTAYSWGTPYPWGDLQALRGTIRDFSPHECRPMGLIVTPVANDFDPSAADAGSPAAGWPDGRWGWEVVNDGSGGAVSARRGDLRYFLSKPGD